MIAFVIDEGAYAQDGGWNTNRHPGKVGVAQIERSPEAALYRECAPGAYSRRALRAFAIKTNIDASAISFSKHSISYNSGGKIPCSIVN